MKHLIIYADPKQDSITHQVLSLCQEALLEAGAVLHIRDLSQSSLGDETSIQNPIQNPKYQEQMDLILDAQKEIMAADKITFICSVWKGSPIGILKKYLDQVFTQQFSISLIACGKNGVACKKQFGMITIELHNHESSTNTQNECSRDIEYKDVIEHCGSPLEFHLTFEDSNAQDEGKLKAFYDQVTRTMTQFVNSPTSNHHSKWDIHD